MSSGIRLDGIANALRSSTSVWRDVKYEYESIVEHEYANLPEKTVDSAGLKRVIPSAYSHLLERLEGGVNALVDDKFTVEYEIRCNLDREARYSEECAGMSFDVNWKRKDVIVETYIGESREVMVASDLAAVLVDGRIRDINKFAAQTGLNVKDVIDREAGQSDKLVAAFKAYTNGQNKITRLVKGCLIFLDHLREGGIEHDFPVPLTLNYSVTKILESMNIEDVAFVYTEQPEMKAVSAILYAMCLEYPSPVFGGTTHISIPADAKKVYLVGMKVPPDGGKVVVTAELVWSTLMCYTSRFGLGNDLEHALVIACSLYENRYMRRVKLPKVQSAVDMVFPALAESPEGIGDKTYINHDAATVIGRVHQLLMMVAWKDIDVCAQNSSSLRGMSMDRSMMALMSRDSHRLLEYVEDSSLADILKVTHSMRWMEYMTDADLEAMRRVSVFEGFWLVRYPKNVLKDGVVKCLKKGYKTGIAFTQVGLSVDTFRVIRNEVILGGGPGDFDIPEGAYNVSAVGLMKQTRKAARRTLGKKGKRREVSYSGGIPVATSNGPGLVPCKEPVVEINQPKSFGWADYSRQAVKANESNDGLFHDVYGAQSGIGGEAMLLGEATIGGEQKDDNGDSGGMASRLDTGRSGRSGQERPQPHVPPLVFGSVPTSAFMPTVASTGGRRMPSIKKNASAWLPPLAEEEREEEDETDLKRNEKEARREGALTPT